MTEFGSGWTAEVWIDPGWYEFQNSPGAGAPSGPPTIVPIRGAAALIGRPSKARSLTPEIDCTPDGAVSHRHALLTLEDDRWSVEDLGSTNGTFVGSEGRPFPTSPLGAEEHRELVDGDRIYIGAWTRVLVRRATTGEQAGITG